MGFLKARNTPKPNTKMSPEFDCIDCGEEFIGAPLEEGRCRDCSNIDRAAFDFHRLADMGREHQRAKRMILAHYPRFEGGVSDFIELLLSAAESSKPDEGDPRTPSFGVSLAT